MAARTLLLLLFSLFITNLTASAQPPDSLWSRTFGGTDNDYCYAVKQTSDGGYVLCGNRFFYEIGLEGWLVKTDADGDSLWSRSFGGSEDYRCSSVQQTTDGGYVVAGYTESSGVGRNDFWLVKTDANGDSLWSRTYGRSGSDYCRSVIETTDGGYVLAGDTWPFGTGGTDFWLVKTGPDGTPVGDQHITTPHQFSLSVYPNPFNPTTNISFDLPKAMRAQLRIFDITGRVVTTLADEHFPAGTHQLRFDGSAYPSGMYFARLYTTDDQQTRKLILLK